MKKDRRKRFLSLRLKLIITMCFMAVLSVILVTAISIFLFRTSSVENNRTELARLGELARPWATELAEKREGEPFNTFPVGVNPNRIFVIDSENNLLYPQDETPVIFDHTNEHTLELILSGHTVAQSLDAVLMGDETFLYGVPLRNLENNVIGAVILIRPVKEIFSSESQSLRIMFISMAVSMAVAVLLSLLLAGSVTTPLVNLKDVVLNMASGDFSSKAVVRTRDEVWQLSESFNYLSERLQTTLEDLENEKKRLIGVLAGISEGILAIDAQGNLLHANPAAYLLLKLKENDEAALLQALSQTPVLALMLEMNTKLARQDCRFVTGYGLEVEAAVAPVISSVGEPSGTVCVLRDISAAERLEKMRRDYIANISHEFRAPITGIRGFIEPLMDGLIDSPEERFECYRIIHNETLRLERLIKDTLDLSRLQNSQYDLQTEPMEMNGILHSVLLRYSEIAQRAGLSLRATLPDEKIFVMGNEDRIEQVLVILLDNAVRYTPQGGVITVDTEILMGELAVRVADTGIGIPEAEIPYIFERFYKGDKSRSMDGTGLGLAIANEISQLLNGRIVVHSKVGEGSRFEFWLPLALN